MISTALRAKKKILQMHTGCISWSLRYSPLPLNPNFWLSFTAQPHWPSFNTLNRPYSHPPPSPLHMLFPLPGTPCELFWKKKKKVKVLVAQSCPTLGDTMNYSPPGFSVHGTLQARILEWGAISFSRRKPAP